MNGEEWKEPVIGKTPIHFVWTGERRLPDWARANIDRARELHPQREVSLHGDDVLWNGWKKYWDKMKKTRNRADLLKYSVARQIGGWLMDCDVWFLRAISRYEMNRFPPAAGWWGTTQNGYFGANDRFPWDQVEQRLCLAVERDETLWDWFHQWHQWGRYANELFDVVEQRAFAIGVHKEPAVYASLINRQPTLIGTRIIVHGHKNTARIFEDCLLP